MPGERILLTGCTGFVGKFVLRELCLRTEKNTTIICLLRGRKGKTALERWNNIQTTSLYTYVDLSRVTIQEGDLDNLENIQWPEGQEPTLVIHCAANVKTLDSYVNLYRDNVLGVENLCELVLKWSKTAECRLILVSTCYVHPAKTVGKAELLSKDLPRSVFLTDYTYTKFLGEHVAASYSDKFKISIMRLSCVGAPCSWLDAHPTPEAMAHLGFTSLVLRGRVRIWRIPPMLRMSTIPVDIVAKSLVDEVLFLPQDKTLRVKQICADPTSPWNISIYEIYKTLKRLSPKLDIQVFDIPEDEFNKKLGELIAWYTPWGLKNFHFHKEVNVFINKFTDNQVFVSSVPPEYFPSISHDQIYEQHCLYVARGNHQYLLEKGIKLTNIDLFWSTMPKPYILINLLFKKPVQFNSVKEAEERFFNILSSYRLSYSMHTMIDKYKYSAKDGPYIYWSESKANYDRKINLEILGDYTGVTGIKTIIHHSVSDGIAAIQHLLPRCLDIGATIPLQTLPSSNVKSRSLSMSEELMCFIYYFAAIVKTVFEPLREPSSEETIEYSDTTIFKHLGKSFTVSMLKQMYPIFRSALKKDTILYVIPATVESARDRGLSVPHNSFVPIILPWSQDGGIMQEIFLHSKAVKAISTVLIHLVSMTGIEIIREAFIKRVDVCFSSLMASESSFDNIKALYFLSPSSEYTAFTVSALTIGKTTHLTVSSKIKNYPASKLIKYLKNE